MPFARAMSDANRNERKEWLKISLGPEERAVSVASRAIVLSGTRIPAMSVEVAAAHWAGVSALVASNAPTNDALVISPRFALHRSLHPTLDWHRVATLRGTPHCWSESSAQMCQRG